MTLTVSPPPPFIQLHILRVHPHPLMHACVVQALKWGSNIKRKRAQSKKSFAGSSRALERLAAARLAGDHDDGC